MIKNDNFQLYSPTIAKVVFWGIDHIPFVPAESSGLADSNGDTFRCSSETVLYDRARRGRSWFILDLRTT